MSQSFAVNVSDAGAAVTSALSLATAMVTSPAGRELSRSVYSSEPSSATLSAVRLTHTPGPSLSTIVSVAPSVNSMTLPSSFTPCSQTTTVSSSSLAASSISVTDVLCVNTPSATSGNSPCSYTRPV